MKLKICRDPDKKALTIPRAALQLSGLEQAEELSIHTEKGGLVLARTDLTALEAVGLVRMLSELNVALLFQLVQASRDAAEDNENTVCLECGEHDDCGGLSIPRCLLKKANIGPDESLDTEVENGRIIVSASEKADPLDALDPDILTMLVNAGVDLNGLHYLLEQGDTQDE